MEQGLLQPGRRCLSLAPATSAAVIRWGLPSGGAAIRSVLLAAGMEQEGGSTAELATSATQVE